MSMFKLTQILEIGSYTYTKPYICEFPIVIDLSTPFRRMVRVELKNDTKVDRGMSRGKEGEGSMDYYELIIKAPTITDFNNIVSDLRDVVAAHDLSLYSWVNVGDGTDFEHGRGVILGKCACSASLEGKNV